jgi:acyl-CoA synthetase (NDP forming)
MLLLDMNAIALLARVERVSLDKVSDAVRRYKVGVTEDPVFGPLVGFGLGGIHVEVMGDVRFRVTPLTDQDARELVREIRGFRLLTGFRGNPPADVEALEEVLLRVSRLAEEVPEITDLELNPIMTRPPGEGCVIVDVRIRVDQPGSKAG